MFRVRIAPILGLVAAVALSALPADAAQRGGRREGRGAQPQAAPPPDAGRRAVPRPVDGSPPPGGGRDVVVMAPGVGAQNRRRGPNGYPGPIYGPYRHPVYGSFRGPIYGPYRGPVFTAPYRYSHPYYTFRPRTSLGVGFYAGFAVPFPSFAYGGGYPYGAYSYPAPYPVPYPVPYSAPYPATGYPAWAYPPSSSPAPGSQGGQGPPPGGITIVPATPPPGPAAYGGVSIEVTPNDAEVWVDGGYAGRAADFGPQDQPLTLTTGVHRIELRAPGHEPLAFDVNVAAGLVVPFQGVLQPRQP